MSKISTTSQILLSIRPLFFFFDYLLVFAFSDRSILLNSECDKGILYGESYAAIELILRCNNKSKSTHIFPYSNQYQQLCRKQDDYYFSYVFNPNPPSVASNLVSADYLFHSKCVRRTLFELRLSSCVLCVSWICIMKIRLFVSHLVRVTNSQQKQQCV